MNIYIYSDESGVFDKAHNDLFVFGGLILLGTEEKNVASRKYAHAEKVIRQNDNIEGSYELKATHITNKERGSLFRSLNGYHKFGVVVREKEVLERIFQSKKDKQRYLDYVYKIAVKRAFEDLIDRKVIDPDAVERMYFFVDEHTTATNGRYELRESLEQEFKNGTYNWKYSKFYAPIFTHLQTVNLEYCNSAKKLLVRGADIIANRIYYLEESQQENKISGIQNIHVIELPTERVIS